MKEIPESNVCQPLLVVLLPSQNGSLGMTFMDWEALQNRFLPKGTASQCSFFHKHEEHRHQNQHVNC
jgi:hypothetical protein